MEQINFSYFIGILSFISMEILYVLMNLKVQIIRIPFDVFDGKFLCVHLSVFLLLKNNLEHLHLNWLCYLDKHDY